MAEMNEYEKLMYKKEKDKNMAKGVIVLMVLVILIFSFATDAVKMLFIRPNTVENTVKKCFSNGEPYPPVNGIIDHENGWVVVSANANNVEDALIKLRKTYAKLNGKFTTKSVDKIMIAVYEYSGLDWGLMNPYKTGKLLFTSNIWVEDLKSIDWEDIKTYEEFKQKANIN